MSDAPAQPPVSVEHLPTAVVVQVRVGHLVAQSDLDAICDAIDTAQAAAPSMPFILDLSKVNFMGSLAMGTLVGVFREFKTRGQRLVFASPTPHVRQSLSVSHIDKIVDILPDLPAALHSVG